MIRPLFPILAAALAALPVSAAQGDGLTLPPGAVLAAEEASEAARYALPLGPWQTEGGIETLAATGAVTRQAWRIGGTGLSSFQILLSLRQQLIDSGHKILFECDTDGCGGFDFRYGTEVIGEPAMHVDLGDFHFLSAKRTDPDEGDGTGEDDGPDYGDGFVSLLVSRSASAAYVQVVTVGEMAAIELPEGPALSTKAEPGSSLPAAITGEVGAAMEQVGRFVLSDLVFSTGSAELGPGEFTSLAELARYLRANPDKRVALVGHTDAQGSLAGNISLSKRRAQSVLARLVDEFGVASSQLEAEGIGYLSPLASNQTDAGRTLNRRVEAILVSTE